MEYIKADELLPIGGLKYRHKKLGDVFLREGQTIDDFVVEFNDTVDNPPQPKTQEEIEQAEFDQLLKSSDLTRALFIIAFRLVNEVRELKNQNPLTIKQFKSFVQELRRNDP